MVVKPKWSAKARALPSTMSAAAVSSQRFDAT